MSGKRGVGIPVILLHDAEGGIITVELKNGDVYRGFLEECQDNMNCTMRVRSYVLVIDNYSQDCRKTNANGLESYVQMAYIRGSHVVFIIVPDMLQKAPFFNRIKLWRKFKGHHIFGGPAAAAQLRGQSAVIQKSRARRLGPPSLPGHSGPPMR